jgi:hypothetical protein
MSERLCRRPCTTTHATESEPGGARPADVPSLAYRRRFRNTKRTGTRRSQRSRILVMRNRL